MINIREVDYLAVWPKQLFELVKEERIYKQTNKQTERTNEQTNNS